jgi:hypothetical protein
MIREMMRILNLKRQKAGIFHQKLKYSHEELLKGIKNSFPFERASNFG